MIRELVNYSKWLKKDFPDLFQGIVFEGIHIEISLDDHGDLRKNGFKYEIYRKDDIPSKFLIELAGKENIGEMIPIYIIKNKYIDSSGKFFSSNNYYSYFFKLFKKGNKQLQLNKAFDFKSNTTKLKNNDYSKKYENYIKKYKMFFKNKLKAHYNLLVNENEDKSIVSKDEDGNFKLEKDFEHIKNFLEENFWDIFIREKIVEHFITTDTISGLKKISKSNQELLTKTIFLTFNTPYSEKNFDKQAEYYYQKKLSLKPPKNQYEEHYKITGEWPNIFNPILTQDNDKKVFSRHQSHFSQINKKLHSDDILSVIFLLKLVYHGFFPNPLPIFLDKNELNKKVVTIYKKSNSKKSYTQIIKSLIMDHEEDLQNYYIINYSKRKSLIINDVDFVSNFQFWINLQWNKDLLKIFNTGHRKNIQHIFHIEQTFQDQMFDRKLEYFGDIETSKKLPNFLRNNIYKYRKILYSAFYKSRLHLITANIFQDICMPVIRYEICHNKINNKGGSKNELKIKEKLLIYIHLNKLFDQNNINFGGVDMPSELPRYHENLIKLLKGEIDYYQSDEDFAFGTGQLIRFLLDQSESGNKSHAMFEPFLQKLGNFNAFITQINRTLKIYGHKIKMSYGTFDKMMSNSTSYKLEKGKSLKDLETILISGYFAKQAIGEVIENKKAIKNNSDD